MKKCLVLFVLIAAALLSEAAAQSPADIASLKYPRLNDLVMPEITRDTLANGLRLYLVEDHELPLFRMSVRINCGDYLEPAGKIGLVSILGTVLRTGGTTTRTGDELDELLEGIGASVETFGGTTSCGAAVATLSENLGTGVEVLADILRNPVFDQAKIDLEKVAERTAIAHRNDQPAQIAMREYIKLIFGAGSPYARHPEYATISAITRDDLVNFHQTYFRPENVQIAVWGDFDPTALVKEIEKLFGDWQRGATPVPPPPTVDYAFQPGIYLVEKTDVNQSQILIGHLGGLMTDPDYADRIVMNNIMGVGFGSRMVDIVRSREGLAYSTTSSYGAGLERPGVFTSRATTKSKSTGKAIQEMIKVVRSMQTEPPTDAELIGGKNTYLNSFVFQFDTRAEIVNRVMDYDYYGIPDDFLQRVKNRVEQVGKEDVLAAAKANLRPEALKILVVGNPADFDIPLDSLGFGPVTRIDVAIPAE